jgi:hypothetical protein
MEKISYLGFKNCYRMANKGWQVIVSTDVGPRVLFYGSIDGSNHLGSFPDSFEETDHGVWNAYGGHRLWVAPESKPLSYAPDSEPVEARNEGDLCIRLTQKTDAAGIEKEMTVSLDPNSSAVHIGHKITNRLASIRELAVWTLTIFRGGQAFVPLDPYRSHGDALLPSQPLILWPFTNLADPRLKLGDGWLRMTSDASMPEPQKLGLANHQRWAAHVGDGEVFIKRFNYCDGAVYPDLGSNCEIYTAGEFMEVESLGPLARLKEGESLEHAEDWELHSLNGRDPEEFLTQKTQLR